MCTKWVKQTTAKRKKSLFLLSPILLSTGIGIHRMYLLQRSRDSPQTEHLCYVSSQFPMARFQL